MSMAATNCAKRQRENLPVGLTEKGTTAPVFNNAFALI
jgi:hypothetical protein